MNDLIQNLPSFPAQVPLKTSVPFRNPQLDPFALSILKKNVLKPISTTVVGTSAATSGNFSTFFIADRSYFVVSLAINYGTKASGGANTLTVEKVASGTAFGGGKVLLATPFDLTATADTIQFGVLTTTLNDLIMKRGDRLGMKPVSGAYTALANFCLTVLLQEI